MSTAAVADQKAWYLNRWNQLVLGVIAMMAISSPQYTWTLFTGPLNQKLGTTLAELQWTFSLLIVLQTWFSPFQAYLVDRFGPRLLISVGALLSGGSWVLAASAGNLWALYLTYGVIGGFGTGIIYVGIIGLVVRWFPDRRGLAAGLAAAGYGFGAIFTSFPIDSMIKSSGYAHTLMVWGVIQGVIGLLAAQGLRLPPENYQVQSVATAAGGPQQSRRSYSPREMLKNPIFWLLFIMMSMMSTSGLMVVSNVGPFANEYKVAQAL
ncbi:MAG TPA: MFS transporter, partial [Xanthobacteraceae bacterium]|nr:MFS transporter [Xanthobacteraceae bacterium]